MKFNLFGHTIILDAFPNHRSVIRPPIVGTYYSTSRRRILNISEMNLDWIRNALLRKLGLMDWSEMSSETIVQRLNNYAFMDSETYSLYCEFRRRVILGDSKHS